MSGLNNNISRPIDVQTYQVQPNNAIHAPGMPAQATVTLVPDHQRHEKQLGNGEIAKLNNTLGNLLFDTTMYCSCYKVDDDAQKFESLNKEKVFQPYLYLFSILIAFEWQPSALTRQRVQLAAKKASNFLYDVTDGFMAIGQVILGGPDLLDIADIQVMASNRFHPRAWNGALIYPNKYQPIRVGRGLWRKDQGFVLPWDESDAYRVLVHGWGHYALALADEYLDLVRLEREDVTDLYWKDTPAKQLGVQNLLSLDIVAPSIALPIDSIMATPVSSELIPRHAASPERRDYMLKKIREHFPRVKPQKPLEGPVELPLPKLPVFPQQSGSNTAGTGEEILLSSDALKQLRDYLISLATPEHSATEEPSQPEANASAAPQLAGNCWIYVLKPSDQIIGQGIIGTRDWEEGFMLLGAAPEDQVVVVAQIAEPQKHENKVRVVSACVSEQGGITTWKDRTPDEPPSFIDVLPEMQPDQEQLPVRLRVQIEMKGLQPQVSVSALGQKPKLVNWEHASQVSYPGNEQYTRLVSKELTLDHLDGHILLRWNNGEDQKLYICNYSHGGGPCTSGGGRCTSYTAGSYEGNSMVFYLANYDASDREDPLLGGVDRIPAPNQNTRIVSTVIHGGEQYLSMPGGGYAEARSYIFSLGSNQPLASLSATLVLYYDNGARKRGGDLLIYRWTETDGWKPLTTYAPEDQPYLCIPLDQATPETSSSTANSAGGYFDRYRIYWTPHT